MSPAPLGRDGNSPAAIENDIEQTRSDLAATLEALQRKLSPQQFVDQVVGYFRTGGVAEFAGNFGDTVKRNPVPVSLVGIGLAWLMYAGRRGELGHERHYVGGYGQRRGIEEEEEGEPRRRFRAAGSGLSRMWERARESFMAGSERVGGARERAGSSVREGIDEARRRAERVGQAGREVAEQVGDYAGRARRSGRYAAERMGEMAGRGRETAVTMARERPLALAGIALGVGAAVGVLLPRHRVENSILGEAKTALRDKTRRALREEIDVAERAAYTVIQETQRVAQEATGRTS